MRLDSDECGLISHVETSRGLAHNALGGGLRRERGVGGEGGEDRVVDGG